VDTAPEQAVRTTLVSVCLAASAAHAQVTVNPADCHAYEAVAGTMTWEQARTAAAARTFQGVFGHLATITSEAETSFIHAAIGSRDSYAIGGAQVGGPEPAGGWTWITGEPWSYTNWNSGEPNNAVINGQPENRLAWFTGNAPRWNDVAGDVSEGSAQGQYTMRGYIVEYELQPPAVTQQPVAAIQCATNAAFSVTATGSGTLSYQWQIEATPGTWMTLGNDPGPLPGGGAAYAAPINSAFVHIGVLNRRGSLSVRCVISSGCGSVTSGPARLFIEPADLGGQGGIAQPDGIYDNNDFVVFIDDFFNHDVHADLGSTGGVLGPDGAFDNNDFVVFIDLFFQGC
jgi:hypothetical protein